MSESRIYVGNLPYSATEDQLSDFFSQHGEVTDVKIIIDRATGRSKGFGFVTFGSPDSASAAVETNGSAELDGRKLKIDIAKENTRRTGDRGNS